MAEAPCWPLLGSLASPHLYIWRQMGGQRERSVREHYGYPAICGIVAQEQEQPCSQATVWRTSLSLCQVSFLKESSQCVVQVGLGIYYVTQAGLEPRDPPASTSGNLGFQVVHHLGQLLSDCCHFKASLVFSAQPRGGACGQRRPAEASEERRGHHPEQSPDPEGPHVSRCHHRGDPLHLLERGEQGIALAHTQT